MAFTALREEKTYRKKRKPHRDRGNENGSKTSK